MPKTALPPANIEEARIPTLHIVGDNIPQALFLAIEAVWKHGYSMRTEYDRMVDGKYIDPPSRDARVLIEVRDPFAQPRYPPLSFCQIGTYIAEIMGAKDRMVVPLEELLKAARGQDLAAKEWPYTYHQRLFEHPDSDGDRLNQMRLCTDRLAKTPHTRRAVATTAVPNIDPHLKEDIPCLRELQLRCPQDKHGNWVLTTNAMWRSRDLFKAWPDNVIALTFLIQTIARDVAAKAKKPVKVGSYGEFSGSLHIYGQDFGAVGGDKDRGLQSFFETFTEEKFIAKSRTSEEATPLVLSDLAGLLEPQEVEQWHFTKKEIALVEKLIADIESGELMV